jgi:hypothetical protein
MQTDTPRTLCRIAGNGTSGSGSGQLNGPRGVEFGPDNTALIADSVNHRLLKVKLDCQQCS